MICDYLKVEEEWRLLDLNHMVKKIYVLKLRKTNGCAEERLFSVSKDARRSCSCRVQTSLAPLILPDGVLVFSYTVRIRRFLSLAVSVPDAAFAVDNDKGDEMDHACLAIFCVIFMSSSCLFGHAQLSSELASACLHVVHSRVPAGQ